MIRIVVTYSRCGVAESDKEKIFEKFRQVDGSITRESTGSGLGLTISPELPAMPQFATMLVTFAGLGAINALAYALLADQLGRRIRRPPVLTWINRTGGAALITMGALTAAMQRN